MLDLIVLGRIPGTQFQITFEWVAIFVLSLGAITIVIMDLRLINGFSMPKAKVFFSVKSQRLAQLIRRTTVALQADIVRVKLSLVWLITH